MRVALAQMECGWGKVAANLAAMADFAGQARRAGAGLVLFPELTVSGIYKDERVWALAETLDGPSVRQVSELARREGLLIGFGLTEQATPLPYNTYCLVDPGGGLVGVYRKNYIPPLEAPFWQGHHQRPVFSLGGLRAAVAICFDACQPELLANYGRQRVQVVLMPHAWDADPLDQAGQELAHASMAELAEHYRHGRLAGWKSHDAMRDYFYSYIPPQAKQHGFYALFVNQAGRPHEALSFAGPSFAASPAGHILAQTTTPAQQLLYINLPERARPRRA